MAGRRGGTRVLFRRARTRINTPSNPWGVFREGPGGHVPHLLEGGEHSMFPHIFGHLYHEAQVMHCVRPNPVYRHGH